MMQPKTEAAEPTATLAGRRFRVRDHYEIGREKVREFARAVQNRHGAHHFETDARQLGYDAIIAPPTFASVIGLTTTRALLDSVLIEYDLSQILQTDQIFETFRPVVAGDRISSEIVIESIRQFGDNDFINVKFVMINQDGEVAQIGSTTIVARKGVEIDANLADAVENIMMRVDAPESSISDESTLVDLGDTALVLPTQRSAIPVSTRPDFDQLSAGAELPPGTARVTRGDLANYAGVSGDANPIHFSDKAAQLAGLPTVVAHGMLTMGLAGEYLTSWLGDPTAIEKFSVRFAGFVPVEPDTASIIEFTGKVKSVDKAARTATILLGGTSDGRKLFGRAVAEVRFS